MHKHGNSIYFTRDNMVCFPKSGHHCGCYCCYISNAASISNAVSITTAAAALSNIADVTAAI